MAETVKSKLLSELEKNKGTFISGAKLAETLSCSRGAVWKAADILKKEGYPLLSVPNRGYCLPSQSDLLSKEAVRTHLKRPDVRIEIYRDIELCRLTGCPLHIAHISTAKGLDLVRKAKAEGLPVTCEVTPHHLFLNEDDIDSTYNTNLKMNPPLRLKSAMLAPRKGIVDGSIDCLVTDHAPHAQHEKDCEWEIAFFGTIGLETSLPLMLTNMVRTGEISWSRLVEVMAVNPRRVLRLADVKIEKGSKADLTLIDPEKEITVTEDYFESKSKNSAFLGETLMGVASDVFVDGKRTLANGVVAQ